MGRCHGGSGSQLNAKLIKVEAGKGSQAPVIKLDRAGGVTGVVRNTAGEPVQWAAAVTANISVNTTGDCYMYVVNAVTGDRLANGWTESCTSGSISLGLVGPQVIKLYVFYYVGETYVQKWYGGGSFLTAKPVILPASGSKTLNLAF